jgi:hypothetical protein
MGADLSAYGISLPAGYKANRPRAVTKTGKRRTWTARERKVQRSIVARIKAIAPDCIVQCVKNEAQPKSEDPIERARFHEMRRMDGHNKGFPDLLVDPPWPLHAFYIEVKTDKTATSKRTSPTVRQNEMHERIRRNGKKVFVARDPDEMTRIFREAGVRTREAAL